MSLKLMKPPMNAKTRERVLSLYKQGKNLREISALTGYSETTVWQRVNDAGIVRAPKKCNKDGSQRKSVKYAKSADYHKCPECGGKVRLPCMACGIRAQKRRGILPLDISNENQDDGAPFIPSRAEIEQACLEVQAEWTPFRWAQENKQDRVETVAFSRRELLGARRTSTVGIRS